jgi:hypothetical protein
MIRSASRSAAISNSSGGTMPPSPQWNLTSMSNREVFPASSQGVQTGLVADWLPSVLGRLGELSRRPENWDSYGANPLSSDAADTLFDVLFQLGVFIQSEPVISLNEQGGLVAEWSSSQSELELLVSPGEDVLVYYRDLSTNHEWEMPADRASLLEKWLWRASALL